MLRTQLWWPARDVYPLNWSHLSSPLFLTFYSFFVNFTSCTPIPLISLSLCICTLPLQPAHKTETNKKQTNQHSILPWRCSVSQCFAQTSLLTNVHCNESWSGLGPLASATLTILNPHPGYMTPDSSWIYVVVLFHGDPAAALDL